MDNYKVLVLLFLAFISSDLVLADESGFDGGDGSYLEPYQIATAEQLLLIGADAELLTKNYVLTADIDLTGYDFQTAVIAPKTANGTAVFSGKFNGAGYIISNLTIDTLADSDASNDNNSDLGLFGTVGSTLQTDISLVENLGLENVNIQGGASSIYLGGLVARNLGEVNSCYVTGTVQAGGSSGFVGLLCGSGPTGIFRKCYVQGQVKADTKAGGLAGAASGALMDQCYAACIMDVRVNALCGGLVSSSDVSGTNNYYDSTITDLTGGYGTGLPTASMQQKDSFANWDFIGDSDDGFADIWYMLDGDYPKLSWQYNIMLNWSDEHLGFGVGSEQEISWISRGDIPEVLIEYSTDNGETWLAVGDPIANSGSYLWTVPAAASDLCLMRISDAAGAVINDINDVTFSIMPTSPVVIYPAGGEKFGSGDKVQVQWESISEIENMVVAYSVDDGSSWVDIATTENDGIYQWLVPDIMSNKVKLRVAAENHSVLAGYSQAFIVYSCMVKLISDINGDCRVDLLDFALLANDWLGGGKLKLLEYNLYTSPNFQTEGLWQFGKPGGSGGIDEGNPDPTMGFSGNNVYGVNLQGDYGIEDEATYYLTAGPIDCGGYKDVQLWFYSWLNSDESRYARHCFEVSADGSTWNAIWINSEEVIADDSWNLMEFDVSDYADGNKNLYFRWGYQIFDRAKPYSGWNIDDIMLLGGVN
ncbi:MAG: hypothetical protein JEZ07_14750 [Phycisphaerae bacterium]|nr:hypothetical protein [Phycisphaerae bacterium]